MKNGTLLLFCKAMMNKNDNFQQCVSLGKTSSVFILWSNKNKKQINLFLFKLSCVWEAHKNHLISFRIMLPIPSLVVILPNSVHALLDNSRLLTSHSLKNVVNLVTAKVFIPIIRICVLIPKVPTSRPSHLRPFCSLINFLLWQRLLYFTCNL